MPVWIEPGSDNARLTFLKRSVSTAEQDSGSGNMYLSQLTTDSIKTFLSDFEQKVQVLSDKLSARSKESREATQALEKLKTYTRDLWEVLKRRVYRLEQPAEVLTFYELPLSGLIPKPTTREEWLTVADKIIIGDANAVKAGYPPMANPSAAELKEALQSAGNEIDEVAGSDREYDQAQEAVAALRPQASDLIHEVMDELQFNLRKKDDASQRRIIRTYGATYKYLQGEPVDEEEIEQDQN